MSENKSIETPRRVIRERGTSTCQNRVLIITSIAALVIIGVAVILLWRVAALHSEVTIMHADIQLMCAHVSKLDHSRDENNGAPVTSETETERSGYVHSLTACGGVNIFKHFNPCGLQNVSSYKSVKLSQGTSSLYESLS